MKRYDCIEDNDPNIDEQFRIDKEDVPGYIKIRDDFRQKESEVKDPLDKLRIYIEGVNKLAEYVLDSQKRRMIRQCEGDPKRISTKASALIPEILELEHWMLEHERTRKDLEFFTPSITFKSDDFFFTSNAAYDIICERIKVFIEALKDFPEELEGLYAVIKLHINESKYVDHSTALCDEKRFHRGNSLALISKYGLMTDKVNTQMLITDAFTREINGQLVLQWAVDQAHEKRPPVPVYLSLTYDGEDLLIKREMTAYDKAVYEAISTAFYYHKKDGHEGDLLITPQEIWRIMTGLASTSKTPSPNQVDKVCKSVDKMRFTRVYMNISKELEVHHISFKDERLTRGEVDTYLLAAERVKFTTEKGSVLQGYRLMQMPVLYAYNAAKGHLILAPYNLLDTSKKTGNEGNTIVYRNYMLQEVGRMKKGLRQNKRILFDTLYKHTGVLPPEQRVDEDETGHKKEFKTEASRQAAIRRLRKADKDKIDSLLSSWVEKEWIAGYKFIKKGKAVAGVDIFDKSQALSLEEE